MQRIVQVHCVCVCVWVDAAESIVKVEILYGS